MGVISRESAMEMFKLLLLLPTIGAYAYSTAYDKVWKIECPAGQSVWMVRSEHSNWHEDRQWDIKCLANPGISGACSWDSTYANTWDETFDYKCNFNGVITGILSEHHNWFEDRRFKFKCCLPGNLEKAASCNPVSSGYQNKWDQNLFYMVPNGRNLVGIKSTHSNGKEDRLFSFYTCKQ